MRESNLGQYLESLARKTGVGNVILEWGDA